MATPNVDTTSLVHKRLRSNTPEDPPCKRLDFKDSPSDSPSCREVILENIKSESPIWFSRFVDLFDADIARLQDTYSSRCEQQEQKIKSLEQEIDTMKLQQNEQLDTINRLEYRMSKTNLIFHGVSEKNNIGIKETVESILSSNLKLDGNVRLLHAFQVGKPGNGFTSKKTRPVKVVFASIHDRDIVWNRKKQLKGTGIFIDEDLPYGYRLKRKVFYPYVKLARNNPSVKKVYMTENKIIINDKSYDNVADLPFNLSSNPHTEVHDQPGKSKTIAFFGRKSFLSNHHPCIIKENDKTFNCSEQYYFYNLASHLQDQKTADLILAAKDARGSKKLSRDIKGYVKDGHREIETQIMERATLLKFNQNIGLKEKLVNSDGKLVECNPNDKFWSCGLSLHDPNVTDCSKWLGKNVLGDILEAVRDKI